MTQEEARVVTNVVANALLLFSQLVNTLIDHEATNSFVA
jgi:hypothetical protein